MFFRRCLFISALLLTMPLFAVGLLLTSGKWASATVNTFLAEGWHIRIPNSLEYQNGRLNLAQLTLYYQNCPFVDTENISFYWQNNPHLEINTLKLDHHCLAQLPESPEQHTDNEPELTSFLNVLPQGTVQIKALHWQNLPQHLPLAVIELAKTPTALQLEISEQLAKLHIHHQLGKLFLTLTQKNSDLLGELAVHSALNERNRLTVPFRLNSHSIQIEQASIYWQHWDNFPLHAYLQANIAFNSLSQPFPIESAIRLNILSQSQKGKGNLVISSPNGQITPTQILFPLQVTGEIKHDNFILYSAIPLEVSGSPDTIALRFLPGALLRLTGSARFLTIQELRFPLAGIRLNRSGIQGRLQAIFKGESPDFKAIRLHLDGYAREFRAGSTFFEATSTQKNTEKHETDSWNWRFWGETQVHALTSPLNLAGRGHWRGKEITLSEFKGQLAEVKKAGITIPESLLQLRKPIHFSYEKQHLSGQLRLQFPRIAFDYGGELQQPTADLNFNGALESLNFKGELKAGQLGPIRIFARRRLSMKESGLVGRIYWPEQPASAFQSLLPFSQKWVITNGYIKGETAFSLTSQTGLTAGGHFSIRNGALSLPSGEIKGIAFSLPYQFRQQRLNFGHKQPMTVQIEEINVGFPIRQLQVQLQGYYPYSRKFPLRLNALNMALLGGHLSIEALALPQHKPAQLNLSRIQIADLLAFAQYHQLLFDGQINAQLPFWLSGDPCYVCGGKITQRKASYLKFTPALIRAMQKAGYTERILTTLLNESRLSQLEADLNITKNGDMILKTYIKSQSERYKNSKINLNYQHQENLFDLWRSVNYGSRLEQQIEHRIYKKLENP